MSIRSFFIVLFLFPAFLFPAHADLVVFSYNRPLQLYAFLESVEKLVCGVEEIHVVYRADNQAFSDGYDDVASDFDYVIFHKQGSSPGHDFKPLTMAATFDSPSEYIIFGVDDIVVKDEVDLSQGIDLIEKCDAYGLYLRLGNHLMSCYAWRGAPQPVPPLDPIVDDVYAWKFSTGSYDWGYPHSVDMTLFRKKDIEGDFNRLHFTNPNTLEARWAACARKIVNRNGLCFALSKIVNLPLNRVQTTWANPNMNLYTPQELLDMFNVGKKMDIDDLYQVENKSAHMDYEPLFIDR